MIARLVRRITGGMSVLASHGISTKEKLLLAFPMMPSMLSQVLIHNAFVKYYTDMIGLSPSLVGVIYFIFGIWNAVNDPLMGVLIDRMHFRPGRGKYVYLMRVTAPLVVVALIAMVYSSPGWPEWAIFAVFLFELFLLDTAHTAFGMSYRSYVFVAAPTKAERVDVSVFHGYLSQIGGFLATLIPTLLLVGDNPRWLVVTLLTVVIALNALLYWISLRRLRDEAHMYTEAPVRTEESAVLAAIRNIRRVVRSRAFLAYLGFALLAGGVVQFYFTPFLYYMDHVLEVSGILATVVDVSTGLAVFLFFPILGMLSRRLGLKRQLLISMVPAIGGFGALLLTESVLATALAYAVAMFGHAGITIASTPIMGTIIDDDELRTGERKAGLFLGLFALLTIPASGLQAMIFTAIIEFFGYDGSLAEQSARAIMGIRVGAGLVPMVFIALGALPMFFFPVTLTREHELSVFSETMRRNGRREEPEPALE